MPLISLAPEGVGIPDMPPPGVSMEEWTKLREEKRQQKIDLASLSSSGKFLAVERSEHEIHLYRPEVVVASIRDVVEAARHQGAAK